MPDNSDVYVHIPQVPEMTSTSVNGHSDVTLGSVKSMLAVVDRYES